MGREVIRGGRKIRGQLESLFLTPPNPHLARSKVSVIGEGCVTFHDHSGCRMENRLKRMRKNGQGDWLGNLWISLLSGERGNFDSCVALMEMDILKSHLKAGKPVFNQ